MADILLYETENEKHYRQFVRETMPDRATQVIIADLKPLRMLGEEDAIVRNVLFAELAVKAERGGCAD